MALNSFTKNWTNPPKPTGPQELAHDPYPLHERFRPGIPAGKKGWGANGDLDLGLIERLAKQGR